MDQRERYEEYLQDELDEQFSIYSVSHLLSKLSDYSRIISENGIPVFMCFNISLICASEYPFAHKNSSKSIEYIR